MAAVALPARALAAQFVVTEVGYEHSATTTSDSHLRLAPSPETPTDWKAPVDYASAGTVHVRLEVFDKPSDANTRFQVCFEATPSYACTNQSPIYTKPGVYDWATSFPSFYQYDEVDWSKGVKKVALILKDDKNVKPAPENVGEATSKLFMPTNVRVTVTVVSPGSTYVPPPPTASDAGSDVSADADSGDAVVDAPEPSDADAPAMPSDAAERDTGASDDASAAPGSQSDVADEGGCSASRAGASRAHGATAVLALAIAIGIRRRRRA